MNGRNIAKVMCPQCITQKTCDTRFLIDNINFDYLKPIQKNILSAKLENLSNIINDDMIGF